MGRTPVQYAIMSKSALEPHAESHDVDHPAQDEHDLNLKADAVLSALVAARVEPLWWIFSGCQLKDAFGFNIIHALCVAPMPDSLVASLLNEAFSIAHVIEDTSLAAAAGASDASGGWSPLHLCCARGRLAIVQALLSNGVSPSPQPTLPSRDLYMSCSSNATTPLHLAVEYAPIAVSRFLLSHLKASSADSAIDVAAAFAVDGDGCSVLQTGIRGGAGSAVLNLLLPLILSNSNRDAANLTAATGTSHGAAPALDSASAAMFAGAVQSSACVGAIKLIETLLALPGVSKIRNVFGCSVHRAVERCDMKTLRRLLLMGAELGSVARPSGSDDGGGWSALHFAAAAGDAEILDYLLQRDGERNINMQDYAGFTALHLAVHRGNYDCVRLLLMKSANAAVLSAAGLSALHVAIARGDTTMLQILAQKNLDFATPTASATTISLACMSYATALHGPSMLSFLLNGDARSQLLSRDHSHGMCALAVAARGGDPSLFARLIDAGASCNTLSYDGRDIVSHAASSASRNSSVIMSILHAIGVSFVRPSCFGMRPLHYIAEFAPVSDISLFLRLPNVSSYINDPDFSGFTPFLCAARRGRVDACALLQLQGAVASSTTDVNENCLHIACANGHTDLVSWLLPIVPSEYIYAKAGDDLPDCIAAAARAQSTVIMSSLLQQQARAPPGWDVVPLKLAVAGGNAALVQMLMDAGASVERSGEMLLADCAKRGHVTVAELLLKRANAVYLRANWSPAMSPLCHSIIHAPPPPCRPALAHAILDCISTWDSSDAQRILLHIESSTGLAALPLAIIHGHIDIANRIVDIDAINVDANHISPVLSRVYASGLNAACLAAGAGQPDLLTRILARVRCDLSVACAAAGRGRFIDDRFTSIGGGGGSAAAYDDVLQIALTASDASRLDLNEVWNGRQPMWFAGRTGNLAAARALMAASVTVKPALTTEVRFKLDLQRHHTTLQAAAASGNEEMVTWLLTYVTHSSSNYKFYLSRAYQVSRGRERA